MGNAMNEQNLLAIAVGSRSKESQAPISDCLAKLLDDERWSVSPPKIVSVAEEFESEDRSISTHDLLAVQLTLPAIGIGAKIDEVAEGAALKDVEALVRCLAQVSKVLNAEWEIELDGGGIGSIVKGEISKSIKIGLLEEWCRYLGSGDLR